MKVGCLNKISSVGLEHFTSNYQVIEDHQQSDLILVRSAKMHDYPINSNLLAVARAGAGVNNIPLDKMAEAGVVVFNTPGANSNGVKELVIAGMLLASRDIIGGNQWVKENKNDPELQKSVEKAKSAFGGTEIAGKTLLVIGLGAIGAKVANASVCLGMNVVGYDPYISDSTKKMLDDQIELVDDLNHVYPIADFISLHLPLLDSTKEFMNKDIFSMMKKGSVILNFARDLLVNNVDLKEALDLGIVKKYVTDFPDTYIANLENVIYIPHLGASTEESEDNCATMAVHQLMSYVEKGEIINSVNYPNVTLEKQSSKSRLLVLSQNDPEIARKIDGMIDVFGSNIQSKITKVKGSFAYQVYDINEVINENFISQLIQIQGIYRVRVI